MNVLGLFVILLYGCFLSFQAIKGWKNIGYFLVYIAIIYVSLPAFKNAVMYGIDTSMQLGRISALSQTILDGYFPQRILTWVRNSYGWAVGIMYPQLFLYIPSIWGAIFHLNETQIGIYAISNTFVLIMHILTAEFMYIAASRIYKNKDVGNIAALLITLFASKNYLAYKLGAYGEFLGQMCIPIYILGLYYIISGEEKKWYVLTIGMTFLLQSHLVTTFLIGVMTVFFVLMFAKKILTRKTLLLLLKAVGFAVMINLAFLIPLRDYMAVPGLVRTPLVMTRVDPMTYQSAFGQIGFLYTFLFFTSIVMTIIALIKYRDDKNLKISICFLIFTIICILFCASNFVMPNLNKIEQIKSLFANIQFSRRWCTVFGPVLTLSTSYLVYKFGHNISKYYYLCFFVVVLALGFKDYKSLVFDYMNQEYFSNIVPNMNWSDYSYKDTSMDYENVINNTLYPKNEDVEIRRWAKEGLKVTFGFIKEGDESSAVVCPLLYYPGYKAVDLNDKNKTYEIVRDENNLLNVVIDANNKKGVVVVDFVGLSHWKYFDIFSIIAFILFILTICYENGCLNRIVLRKLVKNKGE